MSSGIAFGGQCRGQPCRPTHKPTPDGSRRSASISHGLRPCTCLNTALFTTENTENTELNRNRGTLYFWGNEDIEVAACKRTVCSNSCLPVWGFVAWIGTLHGIAPVATTCHPRGDVVAGASSFEVHLSGTASPSAEIRSSLRR